MLTRQLVTSYSRREIFHRFQVHHYYTGTPFRLKTLSSSEIRELAEERNIDASSKFKERNEVIEAIENEIIEGKLTVKNAAELMSFQDLQNNLKMRNVSTKGAGKQLRQKLRELLEQECDENSIPNEGAKNAGSKIDKPELKEKLHPTSLNKEPINFKPTKEIIILEQRKLDRELEGYYQKIKKLAKTTVFYIHDIPNPSAKFFSSNISDNALILSNTEILDQLWLLVWNNYQ